MQDTYNLGWKVGLVLLKKLKPSVLDTYTAERQQLARELIELDQRVSKAFSQKLNVDDSDDGEGLSAKGFQDLLNKGMLVSLDSLFPQL